MKPRSFVLHCFAFFILLAIGCKLGDKSENSNRDSADLSNQTIPENIQDTIGKKYKTTLLSQIPGSELSKMLSKAEMKQVEMILAAPQKDGKVIFDPITYEDAQEIFEYYGHKFKDRLEENSSSDRPGKGEQTQNVWIEYGKFENFFRKLEELKKIVPISGVRFYFVGYPNKDRVGTSIRLKPFQKKKLTLMACATYRFKVPGEAKYIHRDIISPNFKNQFILTTGYGNHGHLCPPEPDSICNGAEFRIDP